MLWSAPVTLPMVTTLQEVVLMLRSDTRQACSCQYVEYSCFTGVIRKSGQCSNFISKGHSCALFFLFGKSFTVWLKWVAFEFYRGLCREPKLTSQSNNNTPAPPAILARVSGVWKENSHCLRWQLTTFQPTAVTTSYTRCAHAHSLSTAG